MGTGWARASLLRCAFQVDELERKVKSQQDQLFLTRQELTNTSAELKMRAMQAEGGRTQACDRGAGHGSPGGGGGRGASTEGPDRGAQGRGRMGSLGHKGPLGTPSALSPGLPERLELEKKRSRQSLEDSEQLRFKEVPR